MRDNPRDFKINNNFKNRYRINEQIRIREVRLIGPDGAQLGVVPTSLAQQKAQESGLDLIEIAPTAKPPVCKIADWGKMKYDLSIKEKAAKQKGPSQKTIQLTPNIGENDLLRKVADMQKFLDRGHRVLVQVMMKGREAKYTKLVQENTIKKIESLLTNAVMEQVQLQGTKIFASFMHSDSKNTHKPENISKPERVKASGDEKIVKDANKLAEKPKIN